MEWLSWLNPVLVAIRVLLWIARITRMGVCQFEESQLAETALYNTLKGSERIDEAIIGVTLSEQDKAQLKGSVKDFRIDVERHIRRISLHLNKRILIEQSLDWFLEQGDFKDKQAIEQALKFGCIRGRANKQKARVAIALIGKRCNAPSNIC